MPLYRYECNACGHRFRNLELESADTQVACPSCGSNEARRLLSRVTIQFKGSGYYKTDRANKKSKTGTKPSSSEDSSSSGGKEPITSGGSTDD